MWDKDNERGCRCHGMCGTCHHDAPKTKEEKLAHLEKKEAKLQKVLEHIQNAKDAITSGRDAGSEEE